MSQAFIIMQIGNSELEEMFNKIISPTITAMGLTPKRIDKHNEGGLLKSEIIASIEDSDIIIADLTNERPNCYLEVGYAMGRNKFRNLILTAREDHNSDSPNYRPGGKKVHFDLSGYDILFWDPNRLNDFDAELKKRIQARLKLLSLAEVGQRAEKNGGGRKPEIIFIDEKTGSHRSLYAKNIGTGPAINIVRIILHPADYAQTSSDEPLPITPLAPGETAYAYCATFPPNDSISVVDDPNFKALLEYDDTLGNHFETHYEARKTSIMQITKRRFPMEHAARI